MRGVTSMPQHWPPRTPPARTAPRSTAPPVVLSTGVTVAPEPLGATAYHANTAHAPLAFYPSTAQDAHRALLSMMGAGVQIAMFALDDPTWRTEGSPPPWVDGSPADGAASTLVAMAVPERGPARG